MLEILALYWLGKRVGAITKEKGHDSAIYVIITIMLWFGGEIAGFVFGLILTDSECISYMFALIGAVMGAGIAYFIATNLSPKDPTSTPIKYT
jgi:ammonia channel protein AmtB